jgi:hypothetical protein
VPRLRQRLAVDKFNQSDTVENLDRALGQLKESVASLPELYERKLDVDT